MRLLLVPHVHKPVSEAESDLRAARDLLERLGAIAKGRVQIIEGQPSAMELKWILARLDWFAGARMHAAIGAFSSGVPTLGLGYTDKVQGVFDECGIGSDVADLRKMDARALALRAEASFGNREAARSNLYGRLEGIRLRADREMDAIWKQIDG